jgi:succinate dehydrogenase flavin-adding protein (antitoxin of CptAB toxin-antitoxin module)
VSADLHTGVILTMTRLDKLKELEAHLYDSLMSCEDRSLASITKQYRETIKEIEEIEGGESEDEIADILNSRNADGKSRTVRPNRS